MSHAKILIVDDESGIRFAVRDFLERKGFEVREAEDIFSFRQVFKDWQPDAVILDYKLPDGTALDLVRDIKAFQPSVAIIVLTAHGSIELAVDAMKDGADHFVTKPIELGALQVIIERSLVNQRSQRKEQVMRSRQPQKGRDPFLGDSPAIRKLSEQAHRVITSESPVLIQGETGSGKGVLAEWLHRSGSRAEEAFVDLNCAGLSRELLDSELFGHEKGAFTGAVASKPGLLELAHRGTVFLDEIGDMDLPVQAKVLKVVEEKKFRRMGDVRDRTVDIRLVAASHHDLAALVREKKFRNDLYFRISTLPLVVPPLRERLGDIPVLAERILEQIGRELGRAQPVLSEGGVESLQRYAWPGNIRELRNVLERALLLVERDSIEAKHLQFAPAERSQPSDDLSAMTLEQLERHHIAMVLQQVAGKVDAAAERLGIPRSSLYQKIKKFGLITSRR